MFLSHHLSALLLAGLVGATLAVGATGDVQPAAAHSHDDAAARNGPIAFGRFDPNLGDFSIWTAHADGSHQHRLTTMPSFTSDWAPNGASLIFDYLDGDNQHIARINRDGSHQTQLTFGSTIQGDPRYSPDGRHIVFDASTLSPNDPGFTTDIWLMNSDGSHRRQVTRGGFDVEPVFSPDGRQIAFGRIVGPTSPTDVTQSEAVYVVRTDGTDLHQVVAPRRALEHPRWSPDGRLLTFNISPEDTGARGAGSVFSVRPDGHNLRVLRSATSAWKFTKAVWSPDGRKMLVVCHSDIDLICQMNPRTGHFHVVVRTPFPVNYPSWGPEPD
jgi:Tol biopolymer transport system component